MELARQKWITELEDEEEVKVEGNLAEQMGIDTLETGQEYWQEIEEYQHFTLQKRD